MIAADKQNTLFFDDPFLSLAGAIIIVALVYVELFMHEGGHWLFARLFGHRILGFSVGQGRVIFKRENRKHSQFFQFRFWPIGGYVVPVKWKGTESRIESFLISAGGPLFSGLFCATMAMGYLYFDFSVFPHPWNVVLRQVASIMIVLSVIDIAYNSIPHNFRLGNAAVANDGMSMLYSMIGPHFPRKDFHTNSVEGAALPTGRKNEAPAATEIATSDAGRDHHLRFQYHCYLDQYEEALTEVTAALANNGITRSERTYFLTCPASIVLDSRQQGFEGKAVTALEEAIDLLPESEMLRVKLAVLKIIQRFYNEGRRELEEIVETTKSPHIRACCSCGLAIADARQHKTAEAKKSLGVAARIERTCDLYDLAYSAVYAIQDQ